MAETREGRLAKIEDAIKGLEKEVKNPSKILEALKKIENSNREIDKNIKEIKEELSNICERQEKQEEEIKCLMAENRVLKNEIKEINEYIENQDRDKRRNWIEFAGIPLEENENKIQLVERMHNACKINFIKEDIIDVYRKKRNGNRANMVVKFAKAESRDKLQKAVRVNRLKTEDIGFNEEKRAIFANDCLSPKMSSLFWKVRKAKFDNKWKDAWVMRARIFIKRNADDEAINIVSEEDLILLMK